MTEDDLRRPDIDRTLQHAAQVLAMPVTVMRRPVLDVIEFENRTQALTSMFPQPKAMQKHRLPETKFFYETAMQRSAEIREQAQTEEDTVPCKFCDTPTPYKGTRMCNGCWEVERNIRDFVRHWKGRRFLLNLLANSEVPKP